MAGFPSNLFWLFQLSTSKRVQEKYGSLMLFLLKNMFILSVQFEVKNISTNMIPSLSGAQSNLSFFSLIAC